MTTRALIVDDSLTVRMDLSEALEDAGMEVEQAEDLATARDALRGQPPDLIVLDIQLPDGNGIDLVGELRADEALREVPILLLSSRAQVEDRIRGLDAGAHEFVGKPYDRNAVAARAVALCRPREPGQAPRIVMVEDSLATREHLTEALREAGFRVWAAEDGAQGLRLASRVRPDAMVIDGTLPDMTGADVIQRVRLDEALRGTPCLLFTASTSREHELASLAAGADAYLRKDQGTDVLTARLRALVKASRRAGVGAVLPLEGSRVLAVDDSPSYLEELRSALSQDAYDFIQAGSGEEALELLEVQDVDCVLLDLGLPGISGVEVCRRLKGDLRWSEVPVLVLTSTDDHETVVESIEAGADDYIVKSVELEVIRARVRAQLRRRQQELETRRIREELQLREVAAERERVARKLAESRAAFAAELEEKNILLLQEVQERRRAEQELEAFAYRVSHDLRAPLRNARQFSLLVLHRVGKTLPEQERDFLSRVADSADKMTDLIDALFTFSHTTRKRLQVTQVDLSAIGREIMEDLESGRAPRHHEVAWDIEPGLLVHADPGLLRIVLMNLLSNAVKYSSREERPRVELVASREVSGAIEVRDNGAGFGSEDASRIFGPFERAHTGEDFEGSGIGLATVQRIVERHGGWIVAEGEPGAGATFRFLLPSPDAARPPADEDPPGKEESP